MECSDETISLVKFHLYLIRKYKKCSKTTTLIEKIKKSQSIILRTNRNQPMTNRDRHYNTKCLCSIFVRMKRSFCILKKIYHFGETTYASVLDF